MIHTIFFDVGGTLLEAPNLFEKIAQVFDHNRTNENIEPLITETFFEMYKGASEQRIPFLKVEEIIQKTLVRVSDILECDDKSHMAKELYWDNYVNNSKLYDDTIEVLDELKKSGIKMIVASDADAPLLYEQFCIHNISHYFDRCYISSEIGAYKPSDIFVKALKRSMYGELNRTLIIGDSKVDVVTGKKLGIQTVLKGTAKSMDVQPDFEIKTLKELLELKLHIL